MNTIFETTSAARGCLQSSKQTEVRLLAPLFFKRNANEHTEEKLFVTLISNTNIRPSTDSSRNMVRATIGAHIQKVLP